MRMTPHGARGSSLPGASGARWVPSQGTGEEDGKSAAQAAERAFRALIVDRDSMSSDLLAGALSRYTSCHAATVQSADLVRVLASSHTDVVIIAADLNQKNWSGFDLAESVSRAYPHILIVMLVNQSSSDSVLTAFRAGARGVFSREQPMSQFLECIDQVRKGLIWVGAQETIYLLEVLRSIPAPVPSTADSPALTTRELEVVKCAAKGQTNRVIAAKLSLSEHTVKNYLSRAFEKLGVSSRVELLFYLTLRGHTFSSTPAEDREGGLRTGKKLRAITSA